MSIQCNCEYCQVDGNPCPLAEAQAALAASQAERERLVAELTTYGERVLEEIENANEKQGRLTDAESALAASEAEVERLREQMNTKYWDKVRKDNTSLKRRAKSAETALEEAREKIERLREDGSSAAECVRLLAVVDAVAGIVLDCERRCVDVADKPRRWDDGSIITCCAECDRSRYSSAGGTCNIGPIRALLDGSGEV